MNNKKKELFSIFDDEKINYVQNKKANFDFAFVLRLR